MILAQSTAALHLQSTVVAHAISGNHTFLDQILHTLQGFLGDDEDGPAKIPIDSQNITNGSKFWILLYTRWAKNIQITCNKSKNPWGHVPDQADANTKCPRWRRSSPSRTPPVVSGYPAPTALQVVMGEPWCPRPTSCRQRRCRTVMQSGDAVWTILAIPYLRNSHKVSNFKLSAFLVGNFRNCLFQQDFCIKKPFLAYDVRSGSFQGVLACWWHHVGGIMLVDQNLYHTESYRFNHFKSTNILLKWLNVIKKTSLPFLQRKLGPKHLQPPSPGAKLWQDPSQNQLGLPSRIDTSSVHLQTSKVDVFLPGLASPWASFNYDSLRVYHGSWFIMDV